MHEVSAREGSREALQGRPRAGYRAASLTRRQHPPRANGLRMEEPRAVGDPMHVETSFVRNLGGLIRVRQGMPDRLMKAKGRTMSMHADEESDEVVLPVKRSNNEGLSSAETVEGRASPKGNGGQTAAAQTLRRDTASNGLAAARRAARQSKTVRFTALLHHITTDLLKQSYLALTRDAAPGTDGVTWQTYGENLEEKLKDLHDHVHRGSYRARPARRTYIPKADGSKRPLSILCLKDKIVQQAVATVLEAIYEEDFLGFSYGFRPGRGQHDALDALHAGILRKQVSWVLDADIRGFFDAMAHSWIIRFLEHRIADKRILRLIAKWLKVGTVEDGRRTRGVCGAPQGAVISPILANVYLHYAFDLWVHRWRLTKASGDMIVIRYADDTIVGFQHEHEAQAFLDDLKGRMRKFELALHPDKHPGLWWFFNKVKRLWLASLKRRSQTARLSWERFIQCVACFFPPIRTIHPLPCHRFDARTRGRSPVR